MQFAFARGEETVITLRNQAEAVHTAINAAFSEEPGQMFAELWEELLSRVNIPARLSKEDIMDHNQRLAGEFLNPKLNN